MTKNSFTIRPAIPADADAVVAMWQLLRVQLQAYNTKRWGLKTDAPALWRKHFLEVLASKHSFVLVAVDRTDCPVGFLLAEIGPPASILAVRCRGDIGDLFVRKEYRKQGLGRRLMNQAVKIMKARGAEYVTIFVSSSNRSAVQFYKSLGLMPIEQQMFKKL